MANDELKKKFEEARKRLEQDSGAYDGVSDDIEKECGPHEGPHFAPRNDIEYRRVIREIRESGKDDD